MASLPSKILILIFLIFPFGQLIRINLLNQSILLFDILISIYSLSNLIFTRPSAKLHSKYLLIFLLISLTSLITNLLIFNISAPTPIFYFIRLSAYLLLFAFPPKLPFKNIKFFYLLSSLSLIFFGLLQYLIWPDLTYFDSLNWDPHLNRLTSSLLDPSFTGLLYLIFLIFLFFKFKNPLRNFILILTYITISLTYSRATLLSLLTISVYLTYKFKHLRIFILTLLLITSTIILLPKPYGEGTKLDRTASIYAKIENYQLALYTIGKSPILGVGYNTLPHQTENPLSHSKGGFDNSLLTVFAAGGLFGFIFFLMAFTTIYRHSSIFYRSVLLASLIHSFFSNSLLYPFISFVLLILYCLDQTRYHN